jgi:phage terminase large subunit-like protein
MRTMDFMSAALHTFAATVGLKASSAPGLMSARAEPVAGLFEAGKARLAGRFPELEEQLGGLVAGGDYAGPGLSTGKSPDRADAMVWALWALMVKARAEPRVHSF